MTTFCTNCGSAIGDDQKFCNKCGSAVIVSTAPPASPAQPLAPSGAPPSVNITAVPVAASSPAPPVRAIPGKSSGALKVIVAIVGFLALVSVLAIGSCFYIGYKVKQKAKSLMMDARSAESRTGTSTTPELHLSEGGAGSSAAAAATVDVPPYPGSTPTSSGGQLSAGLTGAASAQEYLTDDSVDKVEAFYKDKFGSKIDIKESAGNAMFYYLTRQGMTTVTMTRDEESGKTKINIGRIGK
jgi:hypothetical protein